MTTKQTAITTGAVSGVGIGLTAVFVTRADRLRGHLYEELRAKRKNLSSKKSRTCSSRYWTRNPHQSLWSRRKRSRAIGVLSEWPSTSTDNGNAGCPERYWLT